MPDVATALMTLISEGGADAHLENIIDAVQARRKVLELQAGATLVKGAHVQFSNCPEKYTGLNGVTGVILSRSRGGEGVEVLIDDDVTARYLTRRSKRMVYAGAKWTVPNSWVEVIVHVPEGWSA